MTLDFGCYFTPLTMMTFSGKVYYAYRNYPTKEPSARAKANKVLLEKVKVIFEQSKRRYGSPRVHRKLLQQGERCSLGRVKRLMRQAGL
jgi:putative transposase